MKSNIKSFAVLFIFAQFLNCIADPITNVLNAPGYYSFSSGWLLEPTDPNDSWVSIQSSNITLDMVGGSAIQDPATSGVTNFTGIIIAPGLTNIIIKNGLISNMTGNGIFVDAGSSSVTFENITIQNCDAAGIMLNGNAKGLINGVTLTNCSVSTCTGFNNGPAYGLLANYVSNITTSLTNFTYNYSFAAPAYGAYLSNCQDCHFLTTLFGNNTGFQYGVGVYAQNCQSLQFLNSVGSFNSAIDGLSTSTGAGFIFDGTTNSVVNETVASSNGATGTNGTGFIAMNGSGNLFKSSSAQGNFGDNAGTGFALVSGENSSHILDSYSLGNNGANGSYGVIVDTATNCTVVNNKLSSHVSGPIAAGYYDTGLGSNNKFKHNYYYNNATQADVD